MKSEIKNYFQSLSQKEQDNLLIELNNLKTGQGFDLLEKHESQLNERQGVCPHCTGPKYKKNGKKRGVQNYKCKDCGRGFTAYTGTWLAHIHKKELLLPYLRLMQEGLSLDKIRDELKINKKTAFDWRHKINASLNEIEKEAFSGITESDETFFLYSQKGQIQSQRTPRKRGKAVKKRGISDEQVAVIVSSDRKSTMGFKVSCLGRISKKDIQNAIGQMLSNNTVLCSDGHVSYKGFAHDNSIEHHVLRADLKEYIKQGKYHIQHVNSMDSRMKTWINRQLLGVATKYLQNYMNWFHIKEKFETSQYIEKVIEFSATNISGRKNYKEINNKYCQLIQAA